MDFRNVGYLSAADTAKVIRKRLKTEFPGVKFYVQVGSGRGSVNINWQDGPTHDEVNGVVQEYSGADFDGMIDMECSYYHWLLPDGSTVVAHSQGTAGSMGTISPVENEKPHPDAKLVHFGAKYIFPSRHCSRELVERVADELSSETGWDKPEIKDSLWWPTRNGEEPYAYFAFDCTKRVPGAGWTPELTDEYNNRLSATSCFKKDSDQDGNR